MAMRTPYTNLQKCRQYFRGKSGRKKPTPRPNRYKNHSVALYPLEIFLAGFRGGRWNDDGKYCVASVTSFPC